MNRKKVIIIGIMLLALMGTLCACTGKFDAAAYTSAILDVSYKNKTESYMELTGASKEDAAKIFENNLDATMKEFGNLNLPEELEAQYRQLFESVLKNVKYSVAEMVETKEKNYTVDVTVEPVTLFDDTYEEFQNKAKEYADKVSNEVMKGAEMPSDAEMQNQIYLLYYELLNTQVESGLKYGEPKTVTLHINKSESDIYEIQQEDITKLDANMISKELFQ